MRRVLLVLGAAVAIAGAAVLALSTGMVPGMAPGMGVAQAGAGSGERGVALMTGGMALMILSRSVR